ncbi:hypothetical protein K6K41_15845 [Chenggangzhangella methanolivorans]|uniref:histidine kinase n=1 Tax=Chenggangzhangella methanolivorans TaxID=1437009 RepID=A0A9E6UNH0_9HYPH|nr:hypothetical protein K6K41_15845 [Chenggangzhangella methanolivorans]
MPDARGAKTLAVLRDVGERKAYEAELEDARRAAEDALRVRSEFLATMSHELRTPLNGILGFSELLIESGELRSAEGLRYARHVETSSRALLAIVNDLMDVSRLEAGAVELDPQPFSLRELVEGCAAMLRREADRKGLALVVEVADDAPDRLVGDDARLRQVLINLLSNAVKFTDAGSVTLRASCAADGEAAAVLCVVVEDTGIGVPDDKRDRLFKRFSQVDQTTSRRYGGAGLGLSICKSLADLMGADISLASREGEGSVFTLSVRLALGAPEPLRGTTPRLALAAAPSRRGHVAEARPAEPSARTLAADDPELLHQPTLDELVAFLGDPRRGLPRPPLRPDVRRLPRSAAQPREPAGAALRGPCARLDVRHAGLPPPSGRVPLAGDRDRPRARRDHGRRAARLRAGAAGARRLGTGARGGARRASAARRRLSSQPAARRSSPNRAAASTASLRPPTPSARNSPARWIFTVPRPSPSARAISLLD